MLVRLAQTISSKYYIFIFPLNLIVTILVILLAYSTIYSILIIVMHQAGGILPIVDFRCTFFQTGGIIRLNGTGVSNLN